MVVDRKNVDHSEVRIFFEESNIRENGKVTINFGKRFAFFVYTCYTVWAL